MHKRLGEYLASTYPGGGWSVQDDGDGPYIKEWTRTEPQPTDEDVAVWAANESARTALAAIEAKYEAVFGRLRAAMAVAMLADGSGMDAKVAALRAEWSSASSAQSAEIAALIGG